MPKRTSGYASGSSRYWVKVKCPDWKRVNAERWQAFEKAPEPSEDETQLQKKRAELARVLERLDDPNLRPGIARELRKHVATLEREIAGLGG